jgi:ABC-type multidrug transport system fused ATPase/permease subunit
MNQETQTKNFSWLDTVKAIWYFLAEDKKKVAFCSFFLVIIFSYELVPVYIVGKIIDFFSTYEKGQPLSVFYFYLLFVGITGLLVSLTRAKTRNSISIFARKARTRARVWGFERLTEFSLEWHNKENTRNKLQRIFTGADAIVGALKVFRSDLIKIFVNSVAMGGIFLFADLKLVTLAVIYTGLFLWVEHIFGKKIFNLSNKFNQLNQKAGGTYLESAHNMLSIKALGNEAGTVNQVFDREIASRDISIEKDKIALKKWSFFNFLNNISLGFFLYFVGSGVINNTITLGMVLVFFTYFYRLQTYLIELSDLHADIIDLKSDLGNMMPIFKETEFIKTGNESFPKDWQKIEIRNAVMDYGSGQIGLSDFNLVLNRNTKTGIAGLSGSGKSTLAKIILGLYALKSGGLKIGNKDYYSIAHNETLSNITVVLQETELFNLTLRENITMMRSENAELLNMAVEISQLGEVIKKLPEGLNSLIGEKGYMLSGGERQRLGIARAIYKNAPIIILDEATSSLDSETEGKIMEKLLGVYGKDKTFLIIAHRLGTLNYTDNIAVMEKGKVVEEGSYEKLMNNSESVFYRMNKEKKHGKE